MASYRVYLKRNAEKELRRLPFAYLSAIVDKIKRLANQPRPAGVQMLKGEERYFRLRVSDYRIVYEVNDADREIMVLRIGHRRDVYEGF